MSFSLSLEKHPESDLGVFACTKPYLTFVLSARRPCCCQQNFDFLCDSEIFVNPVWSVILAHSAAILILPCFHHDLYCTICPLFPRFALDLFVLVLFRFCCTIVRTDFFCAELKWSDFICPFFWPATHNPDVSVRRACRASSSQIAFCCSVRFRRE